MNTEEKMNFNESTITGTEVVLLGRQATRGSFVFGAALSSLGVLAIMLPLITGVTFSIFAGILLILGGILELVFAFKAPSLGKGTLVFLLGGFSIVAGAFMMLMPDFGLGAMTWLLAGYLIVVGILDIVLSLKIRPGIGWGWTLFSGIVTIALGALIIWQWPVSGIWAVGLYVGIRLLLHGWALMALGIASRDVVAGVTEGRIELLEERVRMSTEVLRETQIALANNTLMLAALAEEVNQKVSAEEVDPSIRELNTRISQARQQANKVVNEGFEVWDKAQSDTQQAFEKLQKSVASAIEQLSEKIGSNTKRVLN